MESRTSRTIALAALLMASLAVIAILGPEHPRSTFYTVILWAAIAAAGSALLALLANVSATPRRVLKRDFRTWRLNRRLDRQWQSHHYLSRGSLDRSKPFVDTPCLVLVLKPPRKEFPSSAQRLSPLEGSDVSCVVECQAGRFECSPAAPDPLGVIARWPDELFNQVRGWRKPGRYKIRWAIRLPNGSVIDRTETHRIVAEDRLHIGRVRRASFALKRLRRHLRNEPK